MTRSLFSNHSMSNTLSYEDPTMSTLLKVVFQLNRIHLITGFPQYTS